MQSLDIPLSLTQNARPQTGWNLARLVRPVHPPHPSQSVGVVAGVGMVASLTACGGGGGGGGVGAGTGSGSTAVPATATPSVTPSATPSTVFVVSPPPSAAQAARFLAQASLGATQADIAAVQSGGYAAWLDAQFNQPATQGHVAWLMANGYGLETHRHTVNGLDNTIWRKLVASPDALRQRVVLALSEICVVSVLGINSEWRQFVVAAYLDILEANAFGNYRNLLQQMSTSPAMGQYLTFRGSAKANPATGNQPDENYARELMQLFTLGLAQLNADGTPRLANGAPVETYDQNDVAGLARVFTGYELNTAGLSAPLPPEVYTRPMSVVASRHESGTKTFLGTTIPAGTNGAQSLTLALDTLFNHPNLPPFIGRQLIQRLVTSNPSGAYVARVAAVFANNGAGVRGDLPSVVRAILLDPEARSDANLGRASFGKLREPVVRFLNWARAFGAQSPSGVWGIGDTSDPASRLGQSPMRASSVFNFFRPGHVPPNTAMANQGLAAPEFQITTESSVAGYVNFMQRAISGSGIGDVRADYTRLLTLVNDSAALLHEINLLLAAGQVSDATLADLKAALDTVAVTTPSGPLNRVHAALVLVMAAPEYIAQK